VNNDLPDDPNPPPKRGGKFKFLLIALVPIPFGVLVVVSRILESSTSLNALVIAGILSLICCIYGSVGMFGGYDGKPGPMPWIDGIVLGIFLFAVEAFIVFFVGCAVSFHGF